MIEVGGKPLSIWPATEGFTPDALQQSIIDTMLQSQEKYRFPDNEQLITELKLRSSIVNAAKALNQSGMAFKVFRESKANPEYWRRTLNGGFQQKGDVKPSDAILDIFKQGSLYGTECATAMTIVWYRALLDIMPEEKFNRLYSDIYLMNWMHLDRDLAIVEYPKAADRLPGDGGYFMNPDVDPLTPEWQGENVFYLDGGLYYGHGVGIRDANGIIRLLNGERKENASVSAYLSDSVKRQNYAVINGFLKH